ncbi:glutaredoxin 2 [[Haemophilus] felis]|nr:glutaredoxin 2 [[Haemophilus] felis]
MKLYVFDHCPYCVRAQMIFGLKKLPVQLEILLNDDEQTPVSLVGKKVVPIFVKEDGGAMPESLDIVRYVDQHYGEPVLFDAVRPEMEAWIKEVMSYYNFLLMPRFIKLPVAEFATEAALSYFIAKKTAYVGDFAEHLANTESYLARLHQDLATLEKLIVSPKAASGKLSMEDILLYPVLRNLTCVKGVVFPEKVADYVATMSEQTKVKLYTEYAC